MLFAQNLIAFLLGVACQVLAGCFPTYAGVFIGPGSLLLSLSDIRPVLDGSFAKHLTIFVLGITCQALAAVVSHNPRWEGAGAALLGAGGVLMNASDLKRVFKGVETPIAPIVTPAADAAAIAGKPPAKV